MSVDLITEKALSAQARVVYCTLVGLNKLNKLKEYASFAAIARLLHVSARTVRRAVLELAGSGWLAMEPLRERSPIIFSFPDPAAGEERAEIRRAQQQLDAASNYGEALSFLWCDAFFENIPFRDHHFPRSFTNPRSHERLQADRFYFHGRGVAIEFNGPQHDGPTERYSQETAQAQMERDRLKQEICKRQRIALITVRPEDLTYDRMRELLGQALPLKHIPRGNGLIKHLESLSRAYIASIRQIRERSKKAPKAKRMRRTKEGETAPS